VATFLLEHRHTAAECKTAYAAWRGYASRLRDRPASASCASGGHRLLWTVHADTGDEALAQLPPWVAERTQVEPVDEVVLP
jgi:glucose-6-phosphate dehydrogenase assembly protein OpcA